MVKSHVEELLHVYRCLFVDIGNTYPELREDLRKDYETLAALADERGINLFCVDLADVGKHLDRCLSEGQFMVCGIPLTGRCPKRIMYPEFLKGLWGLVFNECGTLKEDADDGAVTLLRQVYYLAKKAKLDCPHEAVLDEVRSFVETDRSLPEPEEAWVTTESMQEVYQGFFESSLYRARLEDHPLRDELSSFLQMLDKITSILAASLGPYQPADWKFRHGPGVISERRGTVNKYEFVNWSEMLESVFAFADCAFYNHSSWARSVLSTECGSKNPASRLIAVPKTLTKPRLIAAEPSEHMWCQQNLWHYMRTRTEACWIANFVRFTDQSQNQRLCRDGSVTGSLATLDLSSASDRVTCHFVGQLFRDNTRLLEALRASRTQSMGQDLADDLPPILPLKKFSTMGSACTFPVETLGFACIALAACLTRRKLRASIRDLMSLIGEVTVFGDDIVVPTDCRELVCAALEILDFKVNTGKSYWNGKFRESCGVDAFRGVDVTPVYWRSQTTDEPESIVSAVEVRNSFYKKGYWALAEYLTSTIPRAGLPTVPIGSGVFGLATFGRARLDGLFRRFNVYLQRDEVLCLGIRSKRQIREIRDDSVLLQYFTENPEPWSAWRGGVGLRPKLRLALVWECSATVVS
jgi:hypothetical protein